MNKEKILEWYEEGFNDYIYEEVEKLTKEDIMCELINTLKENKKLKQAISLLKRYGNGTFDEDLLNILEDKDE